MIDTHCHLTYKGLAERLEEVLALAGEANVDRMVTIGTRPDDARKAVALAERFDNIYAAVGVHPHYSGEFPDRAVVEQTIRELAAHPKVVAIGEMGLDRHYPEPTLDVQQRVLEWQLELAVTMPDKPVVIHNRKATEETLAVLRASGIAPQRFDFHCFTGTLAEMDAILDFGAMIGFTGVVTFQNAGELVECVRRIPVDRFLIETDSPYLTPAPHRKVRVNEPKYAALVARFMAGQRGLSEADLIAQADANAERFFHLPPRRA